MELPDLPTQTTCYLHIINNFIQTKNGGISSFLRVLMVDTKINEIINSHVFKEIFNLDLIGHQIR